LNYHLSVDWQIKQRLRAIEIILYWHGKLNTADIIATFGVSRIQASKDIKKYIQHYPNNTNYSLSDRAYLKASTFTLDLTSGSIDEYIDHIGRMSELRSNPTFEKLSAHSKSLNPKYMAAILRSINAKKGLSITYGSKTTPKGEIRTIHPHSLVDTGFRWHIRAYCEKHKDFRDFNLGRIFEEPTITNSSINNATKEHDEQWHLIVNLLLRANPASGEPYQKLIEMEFDMEQGTLCVPTRACLVHYMLQRYQIDPDQLDNPSETQTLIVDNSKALLPFLFG